MNLLPPLGLLERWQTEGLSPQEIYARCKEMDKNRKRALSESVVKKTRASRQEATKAEKEQQRQREVEEIRSLREQNKTWQEIGQAIGRSAWYSSQLAKEAGINIKINSKPFRRPRKLPSSEELAQLCQLKSAREISKLYSVTPDAVYKGLDRAGIPRRRYKPRGKS